MTSRVARPMVPTPKRPSSQRSLSALRAKYDLLDKVGAGGAGTVVHAVHKPTRDHVAVKVVPKNLLVDRHGKLALAREVSVLSKLSHPNVLEFRDAFEDSNYVYIATEFCGRGDLYNYLQKHGVPLVEREALKYLRQILKALEYLHSKGISHRDVKPENVLMCGKGQIKLADFGMCHWRRPGGEKSTREYCGTPQYAAPEILARVAYVPERADMWACGVVLYAMLTRTLPFVGRNLNELKRSVLSADTERVLSATMLNSVSEGTRDVLRALLDTKPSRRPSASLALELVDDALLGVKSVRRRSH